MDFVFLDTETTGLEENDEVIQLAYVVSKDGKKVVMNKLYKPGCTISPHAMATHHITPEKVQDKGVLDMNDLLMRGLEKMNYAGDSVLVAHNAKFDIDMLSHHGFNNRMRVIDTLRCSRHLLDDAEGHSLGVIFYQYGIYREMDELADELGVDTSIITSHDALYDVMMLILVTRRLMRIAGNDPEELIRLTNTPVMIEEFSFGKHKGEKVKDVAKTDASYLEWMLKNMDNLDEDLRHTINVYLGKVIS